MLPAAENDVASWRLTTNIALDSIGVFSGFGTKGFHGKSEISFEDLLEDWSKSDEFTALAVASQSSYRKCISAILYRPQTREVAAKMRAKVRAARLLGVAEPVRQLESIATATPSSIGKPELRAFYNYAKSVTGQRQTDRLIMRYESDAAGRHAFRQSKTGELVDIKETPQLSARLIASRARIKALKLRLQLERVPLELVVNEDNGEPYEESTYRHWVSTARAVAVFGFLACDTVRQAIVRAERLTAELIRTVDGLFASFPLNEENKAQRARTVD